MAKTKLADYEAKRDFTKTAEPSGKVKIRKAEYPRFVIQKHAATRLHYDLRLEHRRRLQVLGGDQGPLARSRRQAPGRRGRGPPPRLRRLRRHHSQGRVRRRHRHAVGSRLLDAGGDQDVDAALRKGELKFTLAGEKLKGSWVLVRMRHDREHGKRNNWLLIKHRDGYERDDSDAVLAEDRSTASGRTMEQIAAGKGRGPSRS